MQRQPQAGQVLDHTLAGVGGATNAMTITTDTLGDVTIVGPEVPLAMGVCDEFYRRGLRLFGPRRAAAELESALVELPDDARLHGALGVAYGRTPTAGGEGYTVDHTAAIFLVNPDGRLAAVFGTPHSAERIAHTAESHQTIFLLEVMGRHSGWLALRGGEAAFAAGPAGASRPRREPRPRSIGTSTAPCGSAAAKCRPTAST